MRMAWIPWSWVLWATVAVVATTGMASAVEPEVIYTRQAMFRIPFHVEPVQNAQDKPREVQLHLSDNQRDWRLVSRVDAGAAGFVFGAPHDGEFWFVVRTISPTGQMLPAVQGPTVPEMKVVVDTTPPVLELEAMAGASGEMIVRWKAEDPNLAGERPIIEYQQTQQPNEPWTPLAISGGPVGQASFPMTAPSLVLRARIADKAGNEARSQVRVDRGGQPLPNPAAYQATQHSAHYAGDPARQPNINPASLVREPGQPPVANQSSANTHQVPAGVRPQLVNSLRFTLEYDVESVGPSGIAKIDLWGTTDQGRTWRMFGDDPDRRSPIEVSTPAEGTYGFRMVVQSGTGLSDRPPVSGDKPDVWVTVDLTPPQARFTAITPPTAQTSGEWQITWEAQDQQLANRPVSLFFSPSPQGPWYPIATGLDNTGLHRWRPDQRVPEAVHLRMKIRDAAGNEAVIDSLGPASSHQPPPYSPTARSEYRPYR